jgi:hypothetical protein
MTNIAFIAQSDMTYDMAQLGSSPQFVALWDRFNGDAVMTVFLQRGAERLIDHQDAC